MITKEYLQQELAKRIDGYKRGVETTTDDIIAEMKSILVLVDALNDYEKAYKAVLKTATQWIKDGCTDKEKICLECVFPELRESEDERIRKAIVNLMEVASEAYLIEATGFKKEQFLSYLEKQKVLTEHKEGIYYYHRDGTFTFISHPAVENPHNFTVPKPNEKPVDYDHEMWKNCEANFECGKKEVIDHPEKYGLQKEQKSAEWSEEDEKVYNNALDALYYKDLNNKDDVLSALKDLCDLISKKRKVIPTYARYRPSEEQMRMLRAVIIDPNNSGAESCQIALRGLYEQLKKL